jgi:hypothetical protein
LNYTEQQLEVKRLLESGVSVREAARLVLERESRESTIRSWVKNGLLGEVVCDTNSNPTDDDLADLTQQELDLLCENPDWSVSNLAKRLRAAQRSNNQLRKVQRELFDSAGAEDYDFASVMQDVVKDLVNFKVEPVITLPSEKKVRTVEILFSDLQIGKITEHYNTEVAKRTLKYYGQEVLKKIEQVNPERLIFTALGDNCECNDKHGIQSAISTDTGNAEQMVNCITEVWKSVLLPIFSLGIPVDFHGVQGNHLSSTIKGMGNFYEGRYGWDYAIYSAWKLLAETMNFTHVTFTLPEGIFGTYEIYGKTTVYEHGYELKGQGEGAMQNLKEKRMNNTKKWIDRIVIGDRHHSEIYGCGDYVLNGSFFGISQKGVEYAGNLGFNANPMQTVLVHEPTDLPNVSTVVGIHCIQIVKGYGL